MNENYTRLQAVLNFEHDEELIKHYHAIRSEYATLNSHSDVIRHILERDRQVSEVYGIAWDWRVVTKPPPWMDKILGAIKAFDGRATVIVQDSDDEESRIEFGEGMFEE